MLLVNPVRDGLNLVAKEGPLLNTADGVLVLSRQAGAWEELALGGGGALGVNPFDVAGTAEALHAALSMDAAERARSGPRALRAAVRGAHGGRLVGRPAGGRSALSGRRAAPAAAASASVAQQRDRAGGAGHRQVGRGGHRGRALGVDGGHPHRVRSGRPSASCSRRSAAKAGRSPMSSPKAAAAAAARPRVVLGHQRAHHRPLVDVERRAQLALVPALDAP